MIRRFFTPALVFLPVFLILLQPLVSLGTVSAQDAPNQEAPVTEPVPCGHSDTYNPNAAQRSERPCTLNDIKPLVQNIIKIAIWIIFSVFVTAVLALIAWEITMTSDKAQAKTIVKKRLGNVIKATIILIIALNIKKILLAIQFKSQILEFIPDSLLMNFPQLPFIATAYAAQIDGVLMTKMSLYDFAVLILRSFLQWIVIPAVVVSFAITGFKFVFAQGNPQQINEAKQWLLWSSIATAIVAVATTFAVVLRNTVNGFF